MLSECMQDARFAARLGYTTGGARSPLRSPVGPFTGLTRAALTSLAFSNLSIYVGPFFLTVDWQHIAGLKYTTGCMPKSCHCEHRNASGSSTCVDESTIDSLRSFYDPTHVSPAILTPVRARQYDNFGLLCKIKPAHRNRSTDTR